jgi:ribonuclease HI
MDGSKISRAAGAGWAICQGPSHPIVSCGRQPLPYAEVFDTEAVAALRGLQEACSSIRAEFATDIYICLDNLEVARSLTFQTKTSSQGIFSAFAKAAQHWPQRTRRPHTAPGRVVVKWVPGHAGILGNEVADVEAKAAAIEAAALEQSATEPALATLAYLKRFVKEASEKAY